MTLARRHACSISRYSQILFWRFLAPISDSGLMFSSPMKTALQPARAAFSMKPGNAVAERVDLQQQADA